MIPALVVPDDQSWTLWGADPAASRLRPVLDAGAAERVLVPEVVPPALVEPLETLLESARPAAAVERRESPIAQGQPARGLPRQRERHEHGEHDHGHDHDDGHGHDGHGHSHHDHHDMMAITGEPSADGLVMEPMEVRLGPLGSPLPGGLVVGVTLDGDVVAEAEVDAVLEGTPTAPDLLAPAAWEAAIAAAREPGMAAERRWRLAAAVERERAVSHLAWLRAFGRLLGWEPLAHAASRALAAGDAGDVRALVTRGRRLASRTSGRAALAADDVRARGLRGALARAAGVADDARADDPLYAALGFEPLLEEGGDALARTRLRAREAVQSLELAAAAERMADDGRPVAETTSGAIVEGPRGPLRAEAGSTAIRVDAPGAGQARAVAADAMIGEEWAAALIGVASFDLSPWRVGA